MSPLVINIVISSITGITTGIIAGILASALYRRMTFNRSKKANIEICDYVIKRYTKDNVPAIQVKIKNESNKDLADVYVKLFGVTYYDSDKYHQNRVFLAQKHLDFLPKFDKKDKKCNYFYVPSLISSCDNIHEKINDFDDVLILVKAIDYYDNNIVIKDKIIKKENIKDNKWSFTNCQCSATRRDDVATPTNDEIKLPAQDILDNCPCIKR